MTDLTQTELFDIAHEAHMESLAQVAQEIREAHIKAQNNPFHIIASFNFVGQSRVRQQGKMYYVQTLVLSVTNGLSLATQFHCHGRLRVPCILSA